MKKVTEIPHLVVAVIWIVVNVVVLVGCAPAQGPISGAAGDANDGSSTVRGSQPEPIVVAQLAPTVEPTQPPPTPVEPSDEPLIFVGSDGPVGSDPFRPLKPSVAVDTDGDVPRKFGGQQVGAKLGEIDPAGASLQGKSQDQQSHTWRDGDRTMTVWLQDDLTVTHDGAVELRADSDPSITRNDAANKAASSGLPVFRDQAGSLMTLPGGMLLALDDSWSQSQTDAFFAENGIHPDRVSELTFLVNGFSVDTEPGWPSLQLANQLATLDGVRISSPNWTRERVAR